MKIYVEYAIVNKHTNEWSNIQKITLPSEAHYYNWIISLFSDTYFPMLTKLERIVEND